MSLATHDRYGYSPITGRSDWSWPGGKRLAVYVGLNLEHFAFGEGLGAELAPGGPQPDVLNYAWRDWGNRVGAWRMLELLDEVKLPATVLANSEMYSLAPDLMAAIRARGDEVAGHGRTNSERQSTMSEEDERAMIAEATAVIAQAEGAPPQGWLSPWIAESPVTPDLLAEAGYGYTLNWCMDDQPVWMRTRSGRLLSVPYPQEINDIPAIAARKETVETFCTMITESFDEMRAQSARQPLVMGIALHPYIMGQPFRLRRLRAALGHLVNYREEVWFTRAGDIARHCHESLGDRLP